MSLRRILDVFTLFASVISLLAIILVYQYEILGFIQQYSEAVITFGVVLIYAVSLAAIFYFARKRRIKRNKLRKLAPDIIEFRLFITDQHIKQISDSPEFDSKEFNERVKSEWNTVCEILKALGLPFPEGIPPREMAASTYLEMLIPLAINGDIDEARLFFRRMQGESVDGFLVGLKFWG